MFNKPRNKRRRIYPHTITRVWQSLFRRNEPSFGVRVYMDYASSTPLDRRVKRQIENYQSKYFANPSTLHKEGVAAKQILRDARRTVANILGAHSDEVIFTSGGTEGDNLAIFGLMRVLGNTRKYEKLHIVTTNIEHSAVLQTCKALEEEGVEVTYVPIETDGIVDPKKIKQALKENTVLVSVMYANNEIGTIQPIREIAKVIRHHRKITHYSLPTINSKTAPPFLHTDAAQAINYLPVKVEKLGIDLLTFNGSKMYGPKGVGVLYKKRDVPLSPILHGGNQEFGLRPGTENVAAIVGLAGALKITEEMKEKESKRLTELRNYFIRRLQSEFPNVIINGSLENRLPNNVNISIPGMESELLIIELDARGIAVSAKSACKSDDPDESYVIEALREKCDVEEGSVRFSLGRQTTKKDIDYTLKSLKDILTKYFPHH